MKILLSSVLLVWTFLSFAQREGHFDQKPYVEGEFLVQIEANSNIRQILAKVPAAYQAKLVKELSAPMRIWLIEFDHTAVSHQQMQRALYANSEITVADYNYYVDMRSTVPNDASFTSQWHHLNTGQTGGTADADIDSDEAWDITTGGTTATGDDIVVCMVEGTGGNLNHQDLSPNRWINVNEIPDNSIDDDGNGYVDDYYGWSTATNDDDTGTGSHGTNCLGMIGAKGDNGLNVVGANWDVKLMVLNMGGGLTQSNVIAAYTYPLVQRKLWNQTDGAQGAFVVATSASWGIDGADPTSYPLWCQFYDTLGYYGILNVGATTNSNLDVDTAGDMPTACASPYMVGVGRTDHNDNTAGGYGDQTIDFGAPGINVVTTNGTTGITTTTGTSFSCPLTAGVIGLAYSIPCTDFMNIVKTNPQLAADLVLQALLEGVDPKAQLAAKFITGGRLNSKNTLDILMGNTCSGTLCIAPGSIATSNVTDNSLTVSWNTFSEATESVLYFRAVGAPTWDVYNITVGSSQDITGLLACTDYEYYMESICGVDVSSPSTVKVIRTSGCGNCVDLPYCATSAGAEDEWIESFDLGTYSNVSGSDGGYGNYFDAGSIDLTIGNTYAVTITPEWTSTQYNEQSRVWIDVNQNGTFEAGELLYDQGSATQTPATGNITIPVTALEGQARMRVQMAYQGSGQTTLPNVCGSFTWGEIEDYCVNLISATAGINPNVIEGLKVYPNPASNEVTVKFGQLTSDEILVLNVDGKVVKSIDVAGMNLVSFSTDKLQNGLYFVQLRNNDELVGFKKLIIQK